MPVTIQRKTKETNIDLSLNIRGTQQVDINTGIGFFDHMLTALATHARWDLSIHLEGDLEVDDHHTTEDVAICLGQALQKSWRELADKGETFQRYGQRLMPMDETLVMCAVDISGRPVYVGELNFTREKVGELSTEMVEHFFSTLATSASMTLHLKPEYFRNNHHLAEGCFKALAYALKEALSPASGSASTKGVL